MALEIIEFDNVGMTGSIRTRTGDKLNVLLTENSERAMIMLVQNGELEAFKYVPNKNESGIPYRIVDDWSFDDLHSLLWPNMAITEKRALIIEGLLFFVNTIIEDVEKAMSTHVCDNCRDEVEDGRQQATTSSLH